ncbi:MAG TPA: aldo/keto reductase [Bryobacteraceae bacterium]|nr:aldo/keto reductase [Bryobacteraceae bacterium]
MRRREFFSSAAVAGMASAPAAMAAEISKVQPPEDVPKRVFGKTGEKLTIVGQASGRFPLCTPEEAKAVTQRAYELGINYFDTARLYWGGKSEEVYGEVLSPVRKKIFLTTKCEKYTKPAAEASLAASLKALKTDYIDLWQVHQVSEMSEVEQIFGPNGSLEVFEKAKKDGKVRFIGFTGHRDPKIHQEMLKRYTKWDTILMPLHPADPHYLSFEKEVLPIAIERGMGIQGMKSTANAKLLSALALKDCIEYVLSLPIHCLTLGATTVGQIEDDVRVAKQFKPLNEQQMASIRKRTERLKGPGLEDWKRNTETAAVNTYRDGQWHA